MVCYLCVTLVCVCVDLSLHLSNKADTQFTQSDIALNVGHNLYAWICEAVALLHRQYQTEILRHPLHQLV